MLDVPVQQKVKCFKRHKEKGKELSVPQSIKQCCRIWYKFSVENV